ncbi:MAG: PilT/PilU family type 4a pilus ATPase [Dehalococcoidia bacterium]|nr:MAG: PilT/PilU family type 4a pilus ATPase [Dehalococcoidia bacterium]
MDIISLLMAAAERDTSDVHLIASRPPMLRINGALEPFETGPVLNGEDVRAAFCQITNPEQQKEFERNKELDFSRTLPDGRRVRCNAAYQQGTVSMVIRILPLVVYDIDALGLPPVCKDLILRPRGLIMVSGPTGSGKSTTLAAMLKHLNASQKRRVVTIEDPVEYIHPSEKCAVTQRELGQDTTSFAEALRHVLRQDPDVILVGEMRDTETAAAVMNVAETGHLVLTTGHASSAAQAAERIVDLFPPHERNLVQTRLATLLLGIICQVLVPKAEGKGRAVAVEVMMAIPPIRNLIREGKLYQLPNIIRTNSQSGMVMLDQSLVNLFREGVITREHLFSFCNDRDEVEKLVSFASCVS